jgi:NADH-quinone oxidoreductase subunit J
MTPSLLYLACVASAVGLFLAMQPHRQLTRALGAIVGAGAVAFIMVEVLKALPEDASIPAFEIIFGLGAVLAAARLVTHPRPVFAAIYFVLVIVCSAGLFILLHAEFMAFALIIVYAGAILITYLFVIMLAQEASAEGEAEYDRIPREPLAALVLGFVLLATLSDAMLSGDGGISIPNDPAFVEQAHADRWAILEQLPRQLEATITSIETETNATAVEGSFAIANGVATLQLVGGDNAEFTHTLSLDALPTNTQEVGWQLVAGFPVGLEMAGVILLMAMFGAVVLARRQIELGEDERRVAAGLEPLLSDDDSTGGAA